MQDLAKKHEMVIVVPIYEREMAGVYYNTAAVIDADGTYLGKYRKNHIPHCNPGFWEKFYFKPGNLGYPVFNTRYAKVGVYICYDRHFPEGARLLGLNGAEIVFNPSATVAGSLRVPVEARAARARGGQRLLRGRLNRVGTEAPWNIGEFYGNSYFCDPRGQFLAQARETRTSSSSPTSTSTRSKRSAQHLAVLPRPPPRQLRGHGPNVWWQTTPSSRSPSASRSTYSRLVPLGPSATAATSAMRSTGAGPHQSSLSGVAMYVVASTTPPRRVARRITRCS
jgi:hypothetical protein